MRESTIERELVKRIKAHGGHAYKFTSPGRRNVPDRLVLLPGGIMCFVELKVPGKKARPGQAREHARLWALGFRVLVIDSLVLLDRAFPQDGVAHRNRHDREARHPGDAEIPRAVRGGRQHQRY